MCLTVDRVDLGPADAVLDLGENLLVLNPALSVEDATRAGRWLLLSNGLEQPGDWLTCHCGVLLPVPVCSSSAAVVTSVTREARIAGRRPIASLVASLLAVGVASVAGLVSLPMTQATAAPNPYSTPGWEQLAERTTNGCEYSSSGDLHFADCSTPWGRVKVTAVADERTAAYVFAGPLGSGHMRRFATSDARNRYLEREPAAVPLARRSAYVGPEPVVDRLNG